MEDRKIENQGVVDEAALHSRKPLAQASGVQGRLSRLPTGSNRYLS
jgi:hypothetical protein